MKLEKFKVKNTKKKFIIIFTVCCILLLGGVFLYTSFAAFTEEKEFNVINGQYQDPGDLYFAIYIGDQISNTIPSKGSGYTLDTEKSSCNNGVTVSWDDESWSTIVNFSNYSAGNMSRTKCTMYFKQQTAYEKCIAEGKGEATCNIVTNVDTSGKCPVVNEDGVVNVTGIEDTESLICAAPDDYGTSYYFRGNVTNNYVKFAGFYWRILRLNGDGSVRMIYAGDADVIDGLSNKEEVLANGYNDASTGYTQIGSSAYNSSWNDNAYVGYMYGTSGSSSYGETHANANDSTIKIMIDSWYKEKIVDAGYSGYISDTLFCNDRGIVDYNISDYTNLGYGNEKTTYRAFLNTGENQTLYCAQQNDRFTVDDVNIGNKGLTYPVGLLISDEVILAGGTFEDANYNYYLYTGNGYWSMSPAHSDGSSAGVRFIHGNGYADIGGVNRAQGVRPVLNLKSNSLKLGDGTALNPYTVEGDI